MLAALCQKIIHPKGCIYELKLIRLVIVHTLSKYLIMHLKLELEHVPKCFVKMFGVNNVNIRLSPEVGSIMKMSIYDAI